MQIGNVILGLRQANTVFGDQIFGAAALESVLQNTFTLSSDSAFVVPTGDTAGPNTMDTAVVQLVTEKFSIITANKNDTVKTDFAGLAAYNKQHEVRRQIFNTLLGWYIDDNADRNQYGIQYAGSNIVGINGAYIWWQYDFTYDIEVRQYGPDGLDGRNPDLGNMLPSFDKIYADTIMTPSFKYETLGDTPIPLDSNTTDSAQLVDLTKDPKSGSFWFGFGEAFNRLRR